MIQKALDKGEELVGERPRNYSRTGTSAAVVRVSGHR